MTILRKGRYFDFESTFVKDQKETVKDLRGDETVKITLLLSPGSGKNFADNSIDQPYEKYSNPYPISDVPNSTSPYRSVF